MTMFGNNCDITETTSSASDDKYNSVSPSSVIQDSISGMDFESNELNFEVGKKRHASFDDLEVKPESGNRKKHASSGSSSGKKRRGRQKKRQVGIIC